jgi:hypothetical protein
MALELVTDMGFMDHSSFGRRSLFQELHRRFLEWETLMLARRNDVYAIIFALVVVGPLTWWSLDRTPPFTEVPYATSPDPAHRGEMMESEWDVTVAREGCRGTFQRVLIDSHNVVWAFQPFLLTFTNLPIGHHIIKSATPFLLPKDFAQGRGTILIVVTAECNPVHKFFPIIYRAPPAYFDVQ